MEKQKFGKYLALDTNIHAQDIRSLLAICLTSKTKDITL